MIKNEHIATLEIYKATTEDGHEAYRTVLKAHTETPFGAHEFRTEHRTDYASQSKTFLGRLARFETVVKVGAAETVKKFRANMKQGKVDVPAR